MSQQTSNNPRFQTNPASEEKSAYQQKVEEMIRQARARKKKMGNLSRAAADAHEALERAIILGTDMPNLKLSDRPTIFSPWLQIGDFGVVFSWRGVGKTFFLLWLMKAIMTGGDLGPWSNKSGAKRVLYADGEMPLHGADGVQDRMYRLSIEANPNFRYLHFTELFEKSFKVLNLLDPNIQDSLLHYCEQFKIEVVILDSQKTLFHPPKGEPLSFDLFSTWLLKFKARGITVILAHHAGKDGNQRGGSDLEDYAAFSLKLQEAGPVSGYSRVSHFILSDTKHRHGRMEPVEWTFITPDDPPEAEKRPELRSLTKVTWNIYDFVDGVAGLVRAGVDKPANIATKLRISDADVSMALAQLEAKGQVTRKGYRYVGVDRTQAENRTSTAQAPHEPTTFAEEVLAFFVPGGPLRTWDEIYEKFPKKTSLSKTLDSLVKSGGLYKKEIDNPKTGKGQRARISAWGRPAPKVIVPPPPEPEKAAPESPEPKEPFIPSTCRQPIPSWMKLMPNFAHYCMNLETGQQEIYWDEPVPGPIYPP
jgi:hypothetical protein